MKGTRKRIVLWFMTGLLMVAGLSVKGMTAQAETTEIVLTEISAPSEIDKLENEDKGLIGTHTPAVTGWDVPSESQYYKFTITERSWVRIDRFEKVLHNGWGNWVEIFANASLTKKIESMKEETISNNRRAFYYLDPGTYYLECGYNNIVQTVYAYSLPVSKVMTVSSTLAEDKSFATIAVSNSLTSSKINWAFDEIAAEDINTSNKWPNTSLENSFKVEDNGVYSIRLSSTVEEWADYPVSLTLEISGIVKCEHDFSAYDSDAEGHIKKCSKCGKYETEKKEAHTCDEGTVTTEPTTLKEGVKTFKCVTCGYTIKTETIPKLKSHPYHTILTDPSKNAKYRVIVSADMGTPAVEYYKPVKNLATVSIPAKVKIEGVSYKVSAVAANAFKNNTRLKKITIGSNIDTIEAKAFYGCKNLKNIVISTKKLNTVGKYAIKNINSKATISVPKSRKAAYKKLFTKKTGFQGTMTIK